MGCSDSKKLNPNYMVTESTTSYDGVAVVEKKQVDLIPPYKIPSFDYLESNDPEYLRGMLKELTQSFALLHSQLYSRHVGTTIVQWTDTMDTNCLKRQITQYREDYKGLLYYQEHLNDPRPYSYEWSD